jgi:hypothetical protein
MSSIRIVCTHDALATAETLARILGALLFDVRVSYGRASLGDLEAAREEREAVLLIWSYDAPGTHYMREWLHAIESKRLIEIACAPGWPRTPKRAAPIEFSKWRGERGGRAWVALEERLRAVTNTLAPPKPAPRRAAMALGLVSAAAVGGALLVRVNDDAQPGAPALEPNAIAAAGIGAPDGVGGALNVVEPASVGDIGLRAGPFPQRLAPLTAQPHTPLAAVPDYDPVELRSPTLGERLSALNPIRRDDS